MSFSLYSPSLSLYIFWEPNMVAPNNFAKYSTTYPDSIHIRVTLVFAQIYILTLILNEIPFFLKKTFIIMYSKTIKYTILKVKLTHIYIQDDG